MFFSEIFFINVKYLHSLKLSRATSKPHELMSMLSKRVVMESQKVSFSSKFLYLQYIQNFITNNFTCWDHSYMKYVEC